METKKIDRVYNDCSEMIKTLKKKALEEDEFYYYEYFAKTLYAENDVTGLMYIYSELNFFFSDLSTDIQLEVMPRFQYSDIFQKTLKKIIKRNKICSDLEYELIRTHFETIWENEQHKDLAVKLESLMAGYS